MPLKNRKGLILAAGYGSRLDGHTSASSFKPLIPVLDKPLIIRTIDSLKKAGCDSIVIVLGYGHKEVEESILNTYEGEKDLEFVYNEDYHLSNGVSVLAAKDVLCDVFIMTMADHIIGDSLMDIAGNHIPEEGTAALLVDHKVNTIFDIEDATKVLAENDKVISIGKQLDEYNCIDTGVFVCTKGIIKAIERKYHENGDASISDGVQMLASEGNMHTIDIKDGFWQDVDTPEMLDHAEEVLTKM